MFPGTREILLYALGILVSIMVVLLILILRKRIPEIPLFGKRREEAGAPQSPVMQTQPSGPDDVESIKGKLSMEGGVQNAPQPTAPPGPPVPPEASVSERGPEPVSEDDVIERAAVLGSGKQDEGDYTDVEEKPIAREPEPRPVKEKELVARGLVKPVDSGGIVARFVPRKATPKVNALEPEKVTEEPVKSQTLEAIPVDSMTISKDLNSFLGNAVSIEGDIQLSSRGSEDFWYVLFDKGGSSVVRSKGEIPLKRCRLVATVQKTKLGQIYLDVLRYEKLE